MAIHHNPLGEMSLFRPTTGAPTGGLCPYRRGASAKVQWTLQWTLWVSLTPSPSPRTGEGGEQDRS